MKRFGTMIWSNDNPHGFINCLYTRYFVADSLESKDFWVENGHWEGTYHAGVIYIEASDRTIDEMFVAEPLYIEDFIGVDITDYNDVIETFKENLHYKNI